MNPIRSCRWQKGWTPLHKAYEERIHGSGDLDSKERVANVLLGAGAEVNAVTTVCAHVGSSETR